MTGVLDRRTLSIMIGTAREPDEPDAVVLGAVRTGDRAALETLYRRHAPWLLLRLSRRCADRDLVDEVLQDTFVAVGRRPAGWSGQGEVAAWLWGIASRRLIDGYRRQPIPTSPLLGDDGLGTSPSAEDEAIAAGGLDAASTALERLPVDLREAVRATVVDGLTTEQAARRLGIPAGTVKTRVMRAKAALRRELS